MKPAQRQQDQLKKGQTPLASRADDPRLRCQAMPARAICLHSVSPSGICGWILTPGRRQAKPGAEQIALAGLSLWVEVFKLPGKLQNLLGYPVMIHIKLGGIGTTVIQSLFSDVQII